MKFYPYLIVGLIAFAFANCDELTGQSTDSWQAEAQQRLTDIYVNGRYSADSLRYQWTTEGIQVNLPDPETGQNQWSQISLPELTSSKISRPASQKNSRRSPDNRLELDARGRSLSVRTLESNERVQLIPKSEESGWVRQPKWSPDSQRILFVQSDDSEVRIRPVLAPVDPSYPEVRNHKFARVGEKINSLKVGVVSADGSDFKWLPIEQPEEGMYLGYVNWAANSNEVLVEKLSRFRDHRELILCDVTSGNCKTIFEETNKAWAVGSHQLNTVIQWVDQGNAFLFVSEKDGWRQVFRCSRDGSKCVCLTPGNYDLIEHGFVDEERGWLYFIASPNNATQKYLYRVPLDGSGTLARVTPASQPGTHNYDFSPDGRWAIHSLATFDSPPKYDLVEVETHKSLKRFATNHKLASRIANTIKNPTEFFRLDVPSSEGGGSISMDAFMIKPSDFDSTKKYPVFIYIYGEPYAQTVLDNWGTHHADFHRMIADMGYLVVSIDNRGTAAPKGATWRRSVFGSLGPLSTEDQANALQELGRVKPFVDLDRVAIWGWSGGGSNTLNALFRKPDQYHVGIAVVPKPQPHLYNAWFQEIYMRTREVNAEGYEKSAPINFAKGLKGKLLIVTGSGETNTHIQIVEGLVDRLIELGKPFDYMVYPNRNHGLREGKGTAVHLRMLMARYLMDNLPAGPK